jgi:hypothetical protein
MDNITRQLKNDGMSLKPQRPGPDLRMTLQQKIDGIRATDPATYAIDIAAGDKLLNSTIMTMLQVRNWCTAVILTCHTVYGKGSAAAIEMAAAVYPLVCANCGGSGHSIFNCSSARDSRPPADDGTLPDANKGRDRSRNNRDDPKDDKPSERDSKRGIQDVRRKPTKWVTGMGLCRYCKAEHLHSACKSTAAKDAKAAFAASKKGAGVAAIFDQVAPIACLPCEPVFPASVPASAPVVPAASPLLVAPSVDTVLQVIVVLFALLIRGFALVDGLARDDVEDVFAVFSASVGGASVSNVGCTFVQSEVSVT